VGLQGGVHLRSGEGEVPMSLMLPYWWKNLKNQEQEEQQKGKEPEIINPEFEEKPVVEAISKTSEDYHGGDELTFSMETQEFSEAESNVEQESQEFQEDSKTASSEDEEQSTEEQSSRSEESEIDSEKTVEDSENTEEQTEESNRDEADLTTEYSGKRKLNVAVTLRETPIDRKLRTEFQRFIERIAELETKYEIPNGTQKLSMRQLMFRSINRKALKSCYVDTYKDTVILLVDTSGSMDWWSEILQKITAIAMKRNDIEIYEAPNGLVTRPVKSWSQLEEYYDWSEYERFHEEFMKRTKNRVIIYIGDFDGGDTPYELAMNGNKVYWICNENRYWDTSDHDWCSHSLSEYPKNCIILWAYDEQDLLKIFRGEKTEQRVEEEEW